MNDTPAPRRVRIESAVDDHSGLSDPRVYLDDEDITTSLLAVEWRADARGLPTATLTFCYADIDAELDAHLAALKPAPADEPTTHAAELVGEPTAPLYCLGCLLEVHAARRTEPNPAWTVVNGAAHCREHLKFQDGPVLPDRTPGGILLPGQNGA